MEQPRIYRSAVTGAIHPQEKSGRFEAAGIWAPTDISNIEALTVLDEVHGLARPLYKLRPILRSIRMDTLETTIDVGTGLTGVEKVPALVEATLSAQAYTPVPFKLWKNVVHVAMADEAQKLARHDVMRLHIEDAARDLARMENKQISTELLTATDVAAGTAWNAMATPPQSDVDPFNKICEVIETIEGAGWKPNQAVCHPRVWGGFIRNSYVKGMVDVGLATVGATGGSVSLPGYPTINVITDYALLNTAFYLLDSDAPAGVMGEGPTEAERYRNPQAGFDAYIIRQYLQPKLVLADAIREITGAYA